MPSQDVRGEEVISSMQFSYRKDYEEGANAFLEKREPDFRKFHET